MRLDTKWGIHHTQLALAPFCFGEGGFGSVLATLAISILCHFRNQLTKTLLESKPCLNQNLAWIKTQLGSKPSLTSPSLTTPIDAHLEIQCPKHSQPGHLQSCVAVSTSTSYTQATHRLHPPLPLPPDPEIYSLMCHTG